MIFLALPRVPPGYPRRIPLELFSEDTLSRVDGIDEVVGMYIVITLISELNN